MASSEPPPSKMKSAPTTICALGDDLLREVFLRLPSLPSLVRAALSCPAFLRAVRSSPAFRRRFRDLHPAPLLGIFLDIYKPAMPAFVAVRRRSDPDHAAAIHGADVFLARLPDDEDVGEDEGPGWSMTSCRNGYVVLVNRSTRRAAVYDPLTRGLHLLRAPPVEICEDARRTESEFHVVTPEEDRRSFRVVCVSRKMDDRWWSGQVQVAVFSAASREWQIFPKAGSLQNWAKGNGTLVNGSVYWTSLSGRDLHVLNTATLQFSEINLPQAYNFKVGETSDGKLCVAQQVDLTLEVCVWRADDGGVDRWMPDTTFPMLDAIGKLDLGCTDECRIWVLAIINGTVYLSIHQPSSIDRRASTWLLSFRIETEELKKVCPITYSINESFYPYVMAWPPVLVGRKVNSGLEGA
ncbi:hypothetical protein ACQJBY_046416 [Aegilops geniculata]